MRVTIEGVGEGVDVLGGRRFMLGMAAAVLIGLAGAGQIGFAFEEGDLPLPRVAYLLFGLMLVTAAVFAAFKAWKARGSAPVADVGSRPTSRIVPLARFAFAWLAAAAATAVGLIGVLALTDGTSGSSEIGAIVVGPAAFLVAPVLIGVAVGATRRLLDRD